jgi:hypothetical protein
MSEARFRRFPPVSGPTGWAGAALTFVALGAEGVAVFALIWAAFNNGVREAVPWIIVLLVSFPLVAAGGWLWRLGSTRAGTMSPSSVPNERRKELLWATSVMSLGSVLGFGAFLYLAFNLDGPRRLAFAMAALFFGTAIAQFGVRRVSQVLHRPPPSLLGWSPTRAWVIYLAFPLVVSALLLLTGLFWTDLIPFP